MPHHTATKGDIGVAKATANLLQKGWEVLVPVCAVSPFDLVAYRAGRFLRIQVKYRTPVRGVLEVTCRRQSIVGGRVVMSKSNTEVDIVCVFDAANDRCYYVPAQRCPVHLRVDATRNGQKTGIVLASDYTDIPE